MPFVVQWSNKCNRRTISVALTKTKGLLRINESSAASVLSRTAEVILSLFYPGLNFFVLCFSRIPR